VKIAVDVESGIMF